MRTRCRLSRAKGDVVYLDDMEGSAVCLGPALTFVLVDFIVPLALAVELGHRAGAKKPAALTHQ